MCLAHTRKPVTGSEVEVPNISGVADGVFSLAGDKAQGALKRSTSQRNLAGYTGSGGGYGEVVFNASDSNAMFNGTTNQPSAGLALLCIKF